MIIIMVFKMYFKTCGTFILLDLVVACFIILHVMLAYQIQRTQKNCLTMLLGCMLQVKSLDFTDLQSNLHFKKTSPLKRVNFKMFSP